VSRRSITFLLAMFSPYLFSAELPPPPPPPAPLQVHVVSPPVKSRQFKPYIDAYSVLTVRPPFKCSRGQYSDYCSLSRE
jgi:hypothetical protein